MCGYGRGAAAPVDAPRLNRRVVAVALRISWRRGGVMKAGRHASMVHGSDVASWGMRGFVGGLMGSEGMQVNEGC